MNHRRLLGITGGAFILALLLACGSGAAAPTITSPTAASASNAAVPTAASAPTAEAAATSAPEPTAAPAATVGKVGDRVELNGTALTVTKVTKADKIGDFLKADAGNTYLIAEVVIENVGNDKAPYNPFYFKVKDSDGFEYNAGITTDKQALKSGDLAKGEKARGTVAFEVKKDAKGFVMEYKPIVIGGGDAIRVALE
jgi:hypothetical protein